MKNWSLDRPVILPFIPSDEELTRAQSQFIATKLEDLTTHPLLLLTENEQRALDSILETLRAGDLENLRKQAGSKKCGHTALATFCQPLPDHFQWLVLGYFISHLPRLSLRRGRFGAGSWNRVGRFIQNTLSAVSKAEADYIRTSEVALLNREEFRPGVMDQVSEEVYRACEQCWIALKVAEAEAEAPSLGASSDLPGRRRQED